MGLFTSLCLGRRPTPPPEAGLAAVVGPAALELTPRHVLVGEHYAASFAVAGYPAEVGPAWLEPLLSLPARVDLAVHITPIPTPIAAASLRRQRARFESTRRLEAQRGRLGDPTVEAAAEDAAELAARVARGAARLFTTGIYLTVHARTLEELTQLSAQVRAAAASSLLDLQPATWRHHLGWASTLPLGYDGLGMRRTLDTDALAAAFPLASHDLPTPPPGQTPPSGGVLYGVNRDSPGIVWWDRWALDNHNAVVLARSGAGKSYLVKLDVLRNLYHGVQVAVVDPEDEYTPLAGHVGGTVVALGQPGVRLNPLDLPAGDRRPDTLTRRGLFLHTLISVMLGGTPPPAERTSTPWVASRSPTSPGMMIQRTLHGSRSSSICSGKTHRLAASRTASMVASPAARWSDWLKPNTVSTSWLPVSTTSGLNRRISRQMSRRRSRP
jgi:hypothetical protein